MVSSWPSPFLEDINFDFFFEMKRFFFPALMAMAFLAPSAMAQSADSMAAKPMSTPRGEHYQGHMMPPPPEARPEGPRHGGPHHGDSHHGAPNEGPRPEGPRQEPPMMAGAPAPADKPMRTDGSKKASAQFYGFVRNYFYYDNRANYSSGEGQFFQMPKDENIDPTSGDDLNENGHGRLLSMTTRIGVNLTGPMIWGAMSSGQIEADWNGPDKWDLRLRQAYVRLSWPKHVLTAGQTWHPMSVMNPDIMAYATGSPFQPFSRTPQFRWDWKFAKNCTFIASLLYEFQYLSVGPNGTNLASGSTTSAEYLNNGVMPEIFAGFDFKPGFWNFGAGVDILRLRPRVNGEASVTDEDGNTTTYKCNVDDKVVGVSPMAYVQFNKNLFSAKLKATYGQNTTHLSMYSGYGVTNIKEDGTAEYETLNNMTAWLQLSYGKKYKVSLFGGYSKNLGATDDLRADMIYTRSGVQNWDQIFRVNPEFSYNIKAMNLAIGYELTGTAYGTLNTTEKDGVKYTDGTVDDTHNVLNHRICAMVKYNF